MQVTLNSFEKFLKAVDQHDEKVQMELQGYTETEVPIKDKRNRITGHRTEWEPPENPPRNKVSQTLTDLILEHFPDAVVRKSSAATLLKVWEQAVGSARGNDTPAHVRAMMRIFASLQKLLTGFYTAEGSLATQVVKWRKPVLLKYGDNSEIYKQSIYILGIGRERSLARRQEYTEKVRTAAKTRGGKVKYYSDQIFGVIDKANESKNPVDWIIAVLLATGSRLIECIKVSQYSTVDGQPEMIHLKGVAKDKAARVGTKGRPPVSTKEITKPVLRLTPARVVELVQNIRSQWDFSFQDNKFATGKIDPMVNRRLQDYFGETDTTLPESKKTTAHKLRHIYASLSYQLYGAAEGIPEGEWVREVLGHDSADVSVAYQSIVVVLSDTLPEGTAPEDVRYKVSEISHDMKENREEHKQMQKDILDVEKELNVQIAEAKMIPLEFPQYANPRRVRLSKQAKLERLADLDRALADAGIHAIQRTFRRYNYGSSTIAEYYKIRTPFNDQN